VNRRCSRGGSSSSSSSSTHPKDGFHHPRVSGHGQHMKPEAAPERMRDRTREPISRAPPRRNSRNTVSVFDIDDTGRVGRPRLAAAVCPSWTLPLPLPFPLPHRTHPLPISFSHPPGVVRNKRSCSGRERERERLARRKSCGGSGCERTEGKPPATSLRLPARARASVSANERATTTKLQLQLAASTSRSCKRQDPRAKAKAMFQPQPTPYSPFSSYGAASPLPNFAPFQAASGLVVDSGGPTVFRDPIFSPVNIHNAPARSSFSQHPSHAAHPRNMAGHDMEAQEAAARDFQPALEVCTVRLQVTYDRC
jgi:hypothetical protein